MVARKHSKSIKMEHTHKDALRSKMDLKFYCSKHPDIELKFSTDLSKVGASSAHQLNIKIVVHPCEQCQREHERITDALDVLMSVKNSE
jgi:hypothetical protein